jgi:UDP:flavonoid glycosyltransferase YjiC (YdhE family)
MRIAQVAPLYEAVPPGAYGGTERVIAGLCDGLVAQGHEVTLFAPEGSETAATLEAYGEPLRTRFSADELVNLAPHLHL